MHHAPTNRVFAAHARAATSRAAKFVSAWWLFRKHSKAGASSALLVIDRYNLHVAKKAFSEARRMARKDLGELWADSVKIDQVAMACVLQCVCGGGASYAVWVGGGMSPSLLLLPLLPAPPFSPRMHGGGGDSAWRVLFLFLL